MLRLAPRSLAQLARNDSAATGRAKRDRFGGRRWRVAVQWTLCAALLVGAEAVTVADDAEGVRFFETKIRPVLAEHCYGCHGAEDQESELRVDTLDGMLRGGYAGPAVMPGKPTGSLLLTAVTYQDSDLRMPPDEKLDAQQVADLRRWIEMGAPHPDSGDTPAPRPLGEIDLEQARQHWAFQRPVLPRIPALVSPGLKPIDAFVFSRLDDAEIPRPGPADRATLLRRATFDLTGLPPTPAEVTAFLADDSPQAWQRVVERLLASPAYGERWGRHWLDLARYADSNGLDENVVHAHAWRYRDYVVDALNRDKPYDQFLVEQIAGDLIGAAESSQTDSPAANRPPDDRPAYQRRNERLIATGFLVLGPKVLAEQDETKMEMDIIDEQVDTLGRSVLGLTLGCARCHTHKFDPITHRDYHALAGIFKSTRSMDSYKTVAEWHENVVESPQQTQRYEAHQQRIADVQKQLDQRIAAATEALPEEQREGKAEELEKRFSPEAREELKSLREQLKQLQDTVPERPMAMGLDEGTVEDLAIHLRGSHLTLGDVVPRGFPAVLTDPETPELPDDQSGRLQLAQWLTTGDHPLTARVMVNRLWRWHFGRGLVATVDNFGLQGEPPSHPQLLDWLAIQFVRSGWSIKSMHRMIMLSETYRASSRFDPVAASRDPDNRLLWRFPPQRLEAEAIRDAHLAVSGTLDRGIGGSLLTLKPREYVFNHTSEDRSTYDTKRRSIYVPVIRNHLYDLFQLFDYNDASVLDGDRESSTVAPQALFLMNSPWIRRVSTSLAARLEALPTPEQRIENLYLLAYGRRPAEAERQGAERFLKTFASAYAAKASAPPESDDSPASPEAAAWQALCHAVVASHEFVYLR
ncbi:PSD1 and planctomycete cytochrome C domain-containing protein [Roseimaritima sediminicola]|uniref:PSD1 and planctomycete cytochrome C domain-containing protein n=1 Tax=Roseimaritima sediminicola TaxID=2662066 RepID=UPI0012985182|nr:PSD1 and planctomycete cytochrome C domain-containing protein [Roseimaritima sediminicola]